MSQVNGSSGWKGDFRGLLDGEVFGKDSNGHSYSASSAYSGRGAAAADWRFQVSEFAKGAAEMSVEFGKGVRDVVRQSILRDDSIIMRKLKSPCLKILGKLKFLNEYLPEDRDPLHSWAVIASVWVIVIAVLFVTIPQTTTTQLVQTMKAHPLGARLILLPDGRRLAYREQGVPADQARHSIIATHSFLSSRLAGIPGIKGSVLGEFGIRLVTYDLPGFGESDPHPHRDLESSALDILHLSYGVNISDRFWVLGHAEGSKHAWAALHYIPDRVAGAIMVAPMVNPYEKGLNKDERRRMWATWNTSRKLMYFLARKFPRFLPYFYRRSFLSGNHGLIDRQLSLSLGKKDRAIVESRIFKEFWERDVEESVRHSSANPFVEEAVLQVSSWGFSLVELGVQTKHKAQSFFGWLKSMYGPAEKRPRGLPGPIHIWHGADDRVVPLSMSEFVQRVVPDVMLHKLAYDGHFTYFYFCDECHRQMFDVVFGAPQADPTPPEAGDEEQRMDDSWDDKEKAI